MTRRGLTLAELAVGLILAMFLLAFGFRLLSHGIRSSAKGAAQLTILQGGMLVVSSIERELLRARSVQITDRSLALDVVTDIRNGQPGLGQVLFEAGPAGFGFRRQEPRPGQSALDHVLAADMKFSPIGQEPLFQRVPLTHGGYGVRLRLRVATPDGKDSLDLERLMMSANAPENHPFPEFQGPP